MNRHRDGFARVLDLTLTLTVYSVLEAIALGQGFQLLNYQSWMMGLPFLGIGLGIRIEMWLVVSAGKSLSPDTYPMAYGFMYMIPVILGVTGFPGLSIVVFVGLLLRLIYLLVRRRV